MRLGFPRYELKDVIVYDEVKNSLTSRHKELPHNFDVHA